VCPRRKVGSNKPVMGVVDRSLVLLAKDLPKEAVRDLRDEFTKPNPMFYKLQRMGKWVGNLERTIVGFEQEDGVLSLPRGAIDTVNDILARYDVEVDWRDDTFKGVGGPRIVFSGTLRPYQQIAVEILTRKLSKPSTRLGANSQCDQWPTHPNGILRGPPGSGKTVLAMGVIAERSVPTIVVVHSTALLQQWREACAQFLGFAPGTIQGKTVDIKPVTMAMQQTLARIKGPTPKYLTEFEMVVCDEIHHWGAPLFNRVANLFRGAQRLGVSADERRKDGLEFLINWTFGSLLHEIHVEDLVSIGRLVPIEMTVVPTDYIDGVFLDSVAEDASPDWVGMIGKLTEDTIRNQQIIARVLQTLAGNPSARILVLTERVDHVDLLAGQLFMHNVKVGKMLGGPENRKELERTKRGLQAGRVQVGVGTKVADEGLDIPALTDVFLTCPVHNHPKRIQQMVGRAARPSEGKAVGRATYFWDWLMFPPYPEDDPARERGEQNFIRKLEKGVGTSGKVIVEV